MACSLHRNQPTLAAGDAAQGHRLVALIPAPLRHIPLGNR